MFRVVLQPKRLLGNAAKLDAAPSCNEGGVEAESNPL